MHHLLLQKSDGTIYLVLWHEISLGDTSATPVREVYPPPMPSSISLPAYLQISAVYWTDPTQNFTLQSKSVQHVAGTPFAYDVQDYVSVLQIDTV